MRAWYRQKPMALMWLKQSGWWGRRWKVGWRTSFDILRNLGSRLKGTVGSSWKTESGMWSDRIKGSREDSIMNKTKSRDKMHCLQGKCDVGQNQGMELDEMNRSRSQRVLVSPGLWAWVWEGRGLGCGMPCKAASVPQSPPLSVSLSTLPVCSLVI